jgi:hypothetical protein
MQAVAAPLEASRPQSAGLAESRLFASEAQPIHLEARLESQPSWLPSSLPFWQNRQGQSVAFPMQADSEHLWPLPWLPLAPQNPLAEWLHQETVTGPVGQMLLRLPSRQPVSQNPVAQSAGRLVLLVVVSEWQAASAVPQWH